MTRRPRIAATLAVTALLTGCTAATEPGTPAPDHAETREPAAPFTLSVPDKVEEALLKTMQESPPAPWLFKAWSPEVVTTKKHTTTFGDRNLPPCNPDGRRTRLAADAAAFDIAYALTVEDADTGQFQDAGRFLVSRQLSVFPDSDTAQKLLAELADGSIAGTDPDRCTQYNGAARQQLTASKLTSHSDLAAQAGGDESRSAAGSLTTKKESVAWYTVVTRENNAVAVTTVLDQKAGDTPVDHNTPLAERAAAVATEMSRHLTAFATDH